jgi:hypothetical protein
MQAREQHYDTAVQNLDALLTLIQLDLPKADLHRAGIKVRDLCQTYQPTEMTDQELADITAWINGVTAVIRNPQDQQALAQHVNNTDTAMSYATKNNGMKVFGYAMLAVAAAALCVSFIALLCISPLVLAPLIFASMSKGVATIATIVGLTTAEFGAIISGSIAYSGTLFATRSHKGDIKLASDELETCAYRRCRN